MKNTCSVLLQCVTILFFAFFLPMVTPHYSYANSLSQQPSNSSSGSSEQAFNGHIASLKEKFPSEEQWLNACVGLASQVNYELTVYNKGLNCQLADTKKEIETVKRKIKESDVRAAKLKEKQEEVDRIFAWSNKKLEAARREVEAQQHIVAEATKSQQNAHAAKLKGEVKKLKANITEMEKKSKAFAALSTSINAPPSTKKKTK